MFAFRKNCTFVTHIPNKINFLLISSMHDDDDMDERTGKPGIDVDYNNIKIDVDVVDKLCSNYNCTRNTRRWPVIIFYSVMNVVRINS